MKIFVRTLVVVGLFAFASFLIFYVTHHEIVVLSPKGIIALAEKNLLVTVFSLMLIVALPVFIMLFSFAWRYRATNKKAKYTPDWHESKILETVWWVIPSVIVIILAVMTWKSTHDLDPYKPLASEMAPITIQVVALDWKWLFIYPDQQIATVNFVEFPKNTPINFIITSDAPMNSFWIPSLGTQVYAMSGMSTQVHLMADGEEDYKGVSSNFSGDGFSWMKFVARSVSETSFNEWVRSVRDGGGVLTYEEYQKLRKPSQDEKVKQYAWVEENLYNETIMKYMSPKGMMKSNEGGTQKEMNMSEEM